MGTAPYAISQSIASERTFISRVYGWMAGGLAITGLVAAYTANNPALVKAIFGSGLFWVLILAELGIVAALSWAIKHMTPVMAFSAFLFYAALNGLTLSVIFLIYTAESIGLTFFITAGTFGAMCIYGATTKRDLTSMGSLLFMALIGLVLASVVNIFWHSSGLYWVVTYAGILIFVGLTAYDAQKIKQMHAAGMEGSEEDRKAAILGALALYLDFINLFLYLLRLFGRRK
ncbi:MAG TPA: Bax inhibitor-1/YccA family protein [Terriglobales bacterium]|nr:Bax inhibitor-1/YccA family protein [Terriglobales bacterium]